MCEKCDKIGWNGQQPEIAGAQFGVDFYNLPYIADGKLHQNPQFRIFSEDDTYWHYTGLSASVLWLKDLLGVIEEAIEDGKSTDNQHPER